jgi:hypothetical protein
MCGKKGGKCRCGGVSGAQVKKAVAPQIKASAQGNAHKVNAPSVVPCAVKPVVQPKPTYSIRGVVKDHVGTPLAGAAVTFLGQPAQPPATGNDGAYQFTNLAEGSTGNLTVTLGHLTFVPPIHAVAPLQSNLANLDFDQAAYTVDCALTVQGGADPGPHFRKLLEAAEFVLNGDNAEVKAAGPTGSCSFGLLPSGGTYQVTARLGGVALGPPKPIANLNKAEQLRIQVDTCRIYGTIEKLLADEVDGSSVELRCGAAATKIELKAQPAFEFLHVPKGFKYTLVAKKQGFTIPDKGTDILTQDAERKFSVQMFTLKGRATSMGNGLAGVDIQVSGLRNLKGTVATGADGNYSVDLPKSATPYTVTPVIADCEFTPTSKAGITDKAATADFKQATYKVEVTITGSDPATRSHLDASAGTVGLGGTRRTELQVKLSNRRGAQKPKIGPNTCVFNDVLKGAALTVSLHQPPGYLACPAVPVGADGKATLIATLQPFTIGGTVQKWTGSTNLTAPYGALRMELRDGGRVIEGVPTTGLGAYAFAPVLGGANYQVVPVVQPDNPLITFEPTGGLNNEAYRTHEIKELAANIPNCDFTAMECTLSGPVEARTADFYVSPGHKAVLSAEMVRNLRGERGASHRVRLDLLCEAILYAEANNGQATEANWKKLYDVALNNGSRLTLIFGNKTVPLGAAHFIGNVVTAYHP